MNLMYHLYLKCLRPQKNLRYHLNLMNREYLKCLKYH